MAGEIDLSSGFGDFRSGRFHAGLDLRTGGVPGKELRSPVAGYISKIRMAYTGYGKGLYLTGNDGHIYVFGHLQGFVPKLERMVKSRQLAAKRYYIEFELPRDSFPVSPGELLGYTGQSGVGAPHLHFEKRTPDNVPLNPLTHGFPLKEKVRPTFTRLGVQLTDDYSLLPGANRKIYFDVKQTKAGQYRVDTLLYLNSPFGILADCFDRMKDGGMRQTVYHLQLFVDQKEYYSIIMDSADYATNTSANVMYDFGEAADGEPRVRRLFYRVGNDFAGVQSFGRGKGIIGKEDSLSYGKHALRVVAIDASGNRSELNLSFIWGPQENLYGLDSMVILSDTARDYFFSAGDHAGSLGPLATSVSQNKGPYWFRSEQAKLIQVDSRHLLVKLTGQAISQAALRLEHRTRDGCVVSDALFNGILRRGIIPPEVTFEITDDGIIVRGNLSGRVAYDATLELYYRDSLIGREPLRNFFSMSLYGFFVRPKPEYAHIDRMQIRFKSELETTPGILDSLCLIRVGKDQNSVINLDQILTCTVDTADLYEPQFMELRLNRLLSKGKLRLESDHYEVLPEDLLLKAPIELSLITPPPHHLVQTLGLCRLDKESDKWIWLAGRADTTGLVTTATSRGGSFALLRDTEAPTISGLNVAANQTIFDLSPVFTFSVKDNLSQFDDDRNFLIKLDGEWQIPEYDPESGICRVALLNPMTAGMHHLSIEIKDRAGNEATQYLKFKALPPRSKSGKSKGN